VHGVGRPEPDAEGRRVDCLHDVHVLEKGLEDRRRDLRIPDLPDGEDRVPRGHGGAVLPGRVLPQEQAVLTAVLGDLPLLDEAGRQIQARVEVEKLPGDVLENLLLGQARLEDRVQGRRLPEEPAPENTAFDGSALLRFVQKTERRRRGLGRRESGRGRDARTDRSLPGAAGGQESGE
jgi:hypothetical protein